jgi:RNA polymerase sigma-B factor
MPATLTAAPADRRKQQNLALFREFASSRDPDLRDRLLLMHLPFAHYMARRFRNKGVETEVLEQVAAIGLLKAIDRYDVSRKVEFSTYAFHTILGELKRYFRDKGWSIRIPRRLQELSLQIGKALQQLTQDLRRQPTVSELAAWLEVEDADVTEAILAGKAYKSVSIDLAPSELAKAIGQEDGELGGAEFRADLRRFFSRLPQNQQQIVYLYFWQGMSQAAIATSIDTSHMHVSRQLKQAMTTLQGLMSARG